MAGFLRDWDRGLRVGNYPETTRYNYILAASQLARYLAGDPEELDADAAADDPTDVGRHHVEAFRAWIIKTRSPSTALNKHKGLQPNGIKIRLKRRGKAAGVADVHAHRWRHNYAHEWKLAGGDTGDLMLLLGWTSEDMPRHYGASAASERAQETQTRVGIGERVWPGRPGMGR